MNRQEHLQWCKDRAMKYVESGQYMEAATSMMSDLGKHEETRSASEGIMGMLGLAVLMNPDRDSVIRYIQGFN